jgi:hypothetical protein
MGSFVWFKPIQMNSNRLESVSGISAANDGFYDTSMEWLQLAQQKYNLVK